MKIIGSDIVEAIDWTQDIFETTRPLAEKTLFALLKSKAVVETEEGYLLREDEEEARKHFSNVNNNMTKNWNKKSRIKFHTKRKVIHQENMKIKKQRRLDGSDAATDMENADDSSQVLP